MFQWNNWLTSKRFCGVNVKWNVISGQSIFEWSSLSNHWLLTYRIHIELSVFPTNCGSIWVLVLNRPVERIDDQLDNLDQLQPILWCIENRRHVGKVFLPDFPKLSYRSRIQTPRRCRPQNLLVRNPFRWFKIYSKLLEMEMRITNHVIMWRLFLLFFQNGWP